jgi:hypothetical protein
MSDHGFLSPMEIQSDIIATFAEMKPYYIKTMMSIQDMRDLFVKSVETIVNDPAMAMWALIGLMFIVIGLSILLVSVVLVFTLCSRRGTARNHHHKVAAMGARLGGGDDATKEVSIGKEEDDDVDDDYIKDPDYAPCSSDDDVTDVDDDDVEIIDQTKAAADNTRMRLDDTFYLEQSHSNRYGASVKMSDGSMAIYFKPDSIVKLMKLYDINKKLVSYKAGNVELFKENGSARCPYTFKNSRGKTIAMSKAQFKKFAKEWKDFEWAV